MDLSPRRVRLLADVAEHGMHLVRSGDADPPFAHTVGLFENYLHPEILMFGIDRVDVDAVANGIHDYVREGGRFVDGYHENFSNPRDAFFQPLPGFAYDQYLHPAMWFYKSRDFPVLQYVWPDAENRFPWEDDFDADLLDSAVFLDGAAPERQRDWPWRPEGHDFDDVRVLFTPHVDEGPEEWVWARPGAEAGVLEVVDVPCFTALGRGDLLLDAEPVGESTYWARRAQRRGHATLMLEVLDPRIEDKLIPALGWARVRHAHFIVDFLAVDIAPGDEEHIARVIEVWKEEINFLQLARDQ